jgi:MFS family permease
MIVGRAQKNKVDQALVGYNVSWGTASMIGSPIAGFLITTFFLTLPFYVSSALALLVSVMLLALRNRTGDDPQQVQSSVVVAADRQNRFMLFLPLVAAFGFSFNSGIVTTLFPVSATRLSIPAFQIGLLFFLLGLVQTLVFIFSGKLIWRFGKTSFLIGAVACTVSLALMAFGKNALAFAPSFMGLGLGQGILYSSSLYYLMVERENNRGQVTGSFESTMGLASFLGPFVGGVVTQLGPSYPYVAGAVASFIILVVQIFFRMRPLGKR